MRNDYDDDDNGDDDADEQMRCETLVPNKSKCNINKLHAYSPNKHEYYSYANSSYYALVYGFHTLHTLKHVTY